MVAPARFRNIPIPNYLRSIATTLNQSHLPKGGLVLVHVFHDGWCAVFEGGPCNCNPDIRYERVGP